MVFIYSVIRFRPNAPVSFLIGASWFIDSWNVKGATYFQSCSEWGSLFFITKHPLANVQCIHIWTRYQIWRIFQKKAFSSNKLLEWQPCCSHVLVFRLFRKINLGFSQCSNWILLVFLSLISIYFKLLTA